VLLTRNPLADNASINFAGNLSFTSHIDSKDTGAPFRCKDQIQTCVWL
jgi:hypothetical protein